MNAKPLRCMSIPLGFSTMFMKGNNFCEFLFLPCMRKPFNTGINSKRKEFAPGGANSLPVRVDLMKRESKMKMAELLSLKVFPFTVNEH